MLLAPVVVLVALQLIGLAGGAQQAAVLMVTSVCLTLPVLALDRAAGARRRVETVLEATLGGYFTVAADAMRDVSEIENLLLDFTADPDLLDQWLHADDKILRMKFKPAAVRQRLHQAGVGRYLTSAESMDYRAHSAALHVTPQARQHPLNRKGRIQESSFEGYAGFWEIFQHARRVHLALEGARQRLAERPEAIPTSDLNAVQDAWHRTQELQDAYLALLQGTAGCHHDDAFGDSEPERVDPPDP